MVPIQRCSYKSAAAAAAAALNSTRATLDSSSTRTPVVAILVLLRTVRSGAVTSQISYLVSLLRTIDRGERVMYGYDHVMWMSRTHTGLENPKVLASLTCRKLQ